MNSIATGDVLTHIHAHALVNANALRAGFVD